MPCVNLFFNGKRQLLIRNKQNSIKVKLDKISHLSCKSYKTTLHMMDGTSKEVCVLLKCFDELLSSKGFVRAHRNTLVNMKAVVEVTNGTKLKALLNNGESIEISYRRFSTFKSIFEGMSG